MSASKDDVSAGQGLITHGPESNALIERTLEFIVNELPHWRDRHDRRDESAEERLNAQLCKHLNSAARRDLPAVQFHHEEKQEMKRRVDVSAGLAEGGFIGTTYHSIDDPFIVIEGKRLPSPGGKAREREYVTGGPVRTGGIQRFKLGLHGAGLSIAAMVGYIQKNTPSHWRDRINAWICDLASALPLDEKWLAAETLSLISENIASHTVVLSSAHLRSDEAGGQVEIRHLWLEMARQ